MWCRAIRLDEVLVTGKLLHSLLHVDVRLI